MFLLYINIILNFQENKDDTEKQQQQQQQLPLGLQSRLRILIYNSMIPKIIVFQLSSFYSWMIVVMKE